MRGIQGHSYTETFCSSTSSRRATKRKAPVNQSQSKAARIDAYAHVEKERCNSLGLPCPEQRFDTVMTRASRASPGVEENRTELQILFFAIASSESLVALRYIIQVYRRPLESSLFQGGRNIPQAERLKVIGMLDKNIAYFSLLKRCHIHQLYIDGSRSSRKTGDGFVNDTAQSIQTLQSPKSGNPSHLEDAQASKSMMKEVYPELKQESAEYKKKYRTITDLRKLGQRLNLLVDRFGYGIIGLLPLAVDVSAVDPILNISDRLYVIPTLTLRMRLTR
jgi:hypothetical protein